MKILLTVPYEEPCSNEIHTKVKQQGAVLVT